MSTSNSIRHAVRYALLTSAAAAAAAPAYAADQTIQEVVVTGSRIASPNLETTSPVTQVTADDIAVQGVTRVEDLVNQLPQAFAAQNANVVERRHGYRDGQPARPGLAPHAGAGRRPTHAVRRRDQRSARRPEPDPGRDGRARRSADRRRIRRVRIGRDRRRRQLHHEEGLRGRAVRCHVRPLPAQQRLRRPRRRRSCAT